MTTKKEFLDALAEELRFLPAKQVNEVLKHYRDKIDVDIDYGIPEEKVIDGLKKPEEIAKNIYEMHGVNYLNKRKKRTSVKNFFIATLCVLLILACFILLLFGSVFIWRIIFNMGSLILHTFTFTSILDTVLTAIAILGYLLVMVIAYIYILDLFIILTNELIIKILNCNEKTRGKTYPFMDFSFTLCFNKITKKPKFLLKLLGVCAAFFVLFGIISTTTKGYFYRSFNDLPSLKEETLILQDITEINVSSNELKVEIKLDKTLTYPKLVYEYEFDKMHYDISEQVLQITTDNKKTYDLFNLIKSPTSKLTIYLPNSLIEKINIDIEYADVVVEKINTSNLNVDILSGNLAIIGSNITCVDTFLYTGQIVSSENIIQTNKLTQKSGEYSSTKDNIESFIHQNESTDITIVNTNIDSYELNNISGTIYLEKVSSKKMKVISSTSVNELYDLNCDDLDYTIQSTGKVTITRSKFNDLNITSLNNSYQIINYVKAKNITLKATGGLIVGENININYSNQELDKLGDYKDYGVEYNNYEVDAPNIDIFSEKGDVTLTNNEFNEFEFELNSASSAITDVKATSVMMKLNDVGGEFDNLYAESVDMELTSSSISNQTSIYYIYNGSVELVVNVKMDSKSDFEYPSENTNFKVNQIDN